MKDKVIFSQISSQKLCEMTKFLSFSYATTKFKSSAFQTQILCLMFNNMELRIKIL